MSLNDKIILTLFMAYIVSILSVWIASAMSPKIFETVWYEDLAIIINSLLLVALILFSFYWVWN
jgi:hypothetical protein